MERFINTIYRPSGNAAYFWMPQSADTLGNYYDFKATPAKIHTKIDLTLPGALQDSDEIYGTLGCPSDPTLVEGEVTRRDRSTNHTEELRDECEDTINNDTKGTRNRLASCHLDRSFKRGCFNQGAF